MILSAETLEKARSNYLNLDELVYLYSTYFGENWNIDIFPASISKLKRNGLLHDDGTVTAVGETVLFDCITTPADKEIVDDRFEEIWLLFPRDDEFRNFSKTRMIRTNKSKAKEEYINALNRGISNEDLIKALKNEITYRSSSAKENLFTFMRSPVNWFRNDTYLDYLNEETKLENNNYGKQIF